MTYTGVITILYAQYSESLHMFNRLHVDQTRVQFVFLKLTFRATQPYVVVVIATAYFSKLRRCEKLSVTGRCECELFVLPKLLL